MERPPCEVADIVRAHGEEFQKQYGHLLDADGRRVLRAIQNCRTSILGGHVEECNHCGHRVISYNSCRNRHCPKCQGAARERWLSERQSELLPVPYFHVVFTLPHQLAPLALQNKRVVYGILFRAVAETLLEVAKDPRLLGAEIGFLAVLHTWGQNLQHHPHLHCVVPGGGLSFDHRQWIGSRNQFLLPVKVLSRVFRGKFLAMLKRAFRKGKLGFHGQLVSMKTRFHSLIDELHDCEWVVYTKAPFAGPEHVLRYLAHYTHRVAISNHRILSVADGEVTFRWKDYAHGNKKRKMTLSGCEFLRRFCLHVLPKGFVRIRQFGFLANRQRKTLLESCRRLLAADPVIDAASNDSGVPPPPLCPVCQTGRLQLVERLPNLLSRPRRLDSS
jgi:hypothetical protein